LPFFWAIENGVFALAPGKRSGAIGATGLLQESEIMPFKKTNDPLRIETDWGDYRVSPAEAEKMARDLDVLRKLVSNFPVAELKVELTVLNAKQIRAATSLRLSGQTLYAADDDVLLHPAWENCVRRLVKKVEAYKAKLSHRPVYERLAEGTFHEVIPVRPPDFEAVQKAVDELDYARFRTLLAVYEDALEKRVGRWVERYPDLQQQLGANLTISEIVEEVFLSAFEQFHDRPPLRFGEWIESLIDPAVQILLKQPDEEKENLSFIQSAREAERPAKPE
jgi:hypothetical protein